MRDPLSIIAEAAKRLSPTLITHEIGSDVEIILYNLAKKIRASYENFVVISFNDAYAAVMRYLRSIFNDADQVFGADRLISINPFLEEDLMPEIIVETSDPEIIAGRIGEAIKGLDNSLFFVLGLDLYGVRHKGELPLMIPGITKVLSRAPGNSVVMTFNTKMFPESILEIVNSFALNVVRLEVKVVGVSIKRILTIIRSPFMEYNLKSWRYEVTRNAVIFIPEK
ncbi:hypothetical protein A3L04_05080 [Thermococcus chitonophagus]|uniref:KaiC-like domain-containing protein n=1 Tax=Thermococcus chitonophagus TaxID=54262 RepID=A0A160VU45_9EURY|nr:hypothetical protein [Thermococcus chitonophagus]ASJ16491.1 hypothetical protein A3L04_05080 [Thermococcus chitonophagus]CUX78510.1 hypothetical protein CHITON_1731 [Thermococcus chitonophagus]